MVSAAFIILCATLTLKLLLCLTKNLKGSSSRPSPTSGNIKINDLDVNINSTELMLARYAGRLECWTLISLIMILIRCAFRLGVICVKAFGAFGLQSLDSKRCH